MTSTVLTGLIVMVMHFLHTGRKRYPLPGTEEPMITLDFITALFCEIDEQMGTIPKHPEAHLWPSEVVTLGLLHALKGVGNPNHVIIPFTDLGSEGDLMPYVPARRAVIADGARTCEL